MSAEELREQIAEALRGKQWVRKVMDDGYTSLLQADEFDLAAAVLPVVTAYAERVARARAAEELRAAASWSSSVPAHMLRDRAAALADDGRA